MATRIPLSGDATGNFVPVKVTVTTNGTAQTIHTATNTTGEADDIWLQAVNNTAATVRLTLLKGGVTEPDQAVIVDIPPAGSLPTRIFDGVPLKGGLILKCYAASANAITLDGWVNRYQAV